MKNEKFTAFLFYRYYSEGKWRDSTPYFRTILSMTLLAFLRLFQILILLNKVDIIPITESDKLTKRIVMFF